MTDQAAQPKAKNPNAPDMSGLKDAAMSIQEIMAQNQILIEILREDLNHSREVLLQHKVKLRQTIKQNETLNQIITDGQKQLDDLANRIKAIEASNKELKEKYDGAIWYIGNMSKQTVDAKFVAEVHETYLAHQEQIRRKANQREVAKVHAEEEQNRLDEKSDQADAHNLVTRHQESIKEPSVEAAQPTQADEEVAAQAQESKEREAELFNSEDEALPEIEVEVASVEAKDAETEEAKPTAPKPSLAAQSRHRKQKQGHARAN